MRSANFMRIRHDKSTRSAGERGRGVSRCVAVGGTSAWLAICAVMVIGCEATEQAAQDRDGAPALTGELDPAERARRMAGLGIGLEIRRWHVHRDADAVAARLSQWANDSVLDEEQHERFQRNGLRLFRVPMNEIDELESALRAIGHRQRNWHGQVTRWEPIVTRTLGADRRAVAIDGRVRRFEQREFNLMLRSWIVPTEDGRRLLLAFVPTHDEPDGEMFNRLLGRDNERSGRSITSLHVELLLSPDEAIVLAREATGEAWQDARDEPGQHANDNESRRESSTDARRDEADHEPFGPGAAAPVTLGEVLLSSPFTETGGEVLIFVAHVPNERG